MGLRERRENGGGVVEWRRFMVVVVWVQSDMAYPVVYFLIAYYFMGRPRTKGFMMLNIR